MQAHPIVTRLELPPVRRCNGGRGGVPSLHLRRQHLRAALRIAEALMLLRQLALQRRHLAAMQLLEVLELELALPERLLERQLFVLMVQTGRLQHFQLVLADLDDDTPRCSRASLAVADDYGALSVVIRAHIQPPRMKRSTVQSSACVMACTHSAPAAGAETIAGRL